MCSSAVEMVSSTPLWHDDAIAGFARTETAESRMNSDEIFRFFVRVHITPRSTARLSWHSRPRGCGPVSEGCPITLRLGPLFIYPLSVIHFHNLVSFPPPDRKHGKELRIRRGSEAAQPLEGMVVGFGQCPEGRETLPPQGW